MELEQYEPNIVVFEDDEEYLEQSNPQEQQIFIFDEDQEEQPASDHDSSIDMQESDIVLSKHQYKSRCSQLQDRIIMNNITNFGGLNAPRKQPTFFQQAKDRRKSNQLIYSRRKSRNIQQIQFAPKGGNIKVDFAPQKVNNFIIPSKPQKQNTQAAQLSMSDQIQAPQPIVQTHMSSPNCPKLQPVGKNLNGALFEKKSQLKIQEDKIKNMLRVSNFRQFLYSQLKPSYSIYLYIKRTDNGLINSTYKIYFQQNKKFIMSCEKQGFSKYVFSNSEVHISEDHVSYLGKMECNFFGTEFQMFDSGYEHNKTKMMEYYKKQLASITYSQVEGFPRKIQTLISTCDNQSTQFTILDKDNDILKTRFQNKNKKNICRFCSKDPSYDTVDANYKLNFKGLAGIPSTKNFIVQSSQYPDAITFSRQDKQTYLMRIKSPFSILQAVAVAMSSIHHKFL